MNLLVKNIDKFILFLLMLIFFVLNINLLLVDPLVWPDEAYIADTAKNISQEGRMGSDLWGDAISGTRRSLYWYPPVYINTLAVWFNFFGLSIINQRVLSLFFGMLFLILVYFLSQNIFAEIPLKKKRIIGFSLITLLIFDNSFLKASKMGRPEMMTLLLGFLALYIFQLAEKRKYKRTRYILSGALLSLTTLSHFIGIFFLFIVLSNVLVYRKGRVFNFLLIGFIPLLFIWLISIIPKYDIFFKQLILQQSFRTLVPSYAESVFRLPSLELKMTYILYFLLSVMCFLFLLKKKLLKYLFLYLGLFAGWLICFWGKLEWYSIYIVSFLYILAFILISNTTKALLVIVSVLLVSLFLINIKMYSNSYSFYQNKQNAYFDFGQKVKEEIPAGKTVYLSTTPDLYFILIGRNPLYEFPAVKPTKKEYLSLLNDSDYIIINFHLERLFVGTLLDKYIELNQSGEHNVSFDGLYAAQIIELIPKNMRKLPKI